MAFICFDCIEEINNSTSYFTLVIQCITALVAFFAFKVAKRNLAGVQRSQALNAQMSIIGLEKEIIKYRIHLSDATSNMANYVPPQNGANTQVMQKMKSDIQSSFELYTSTADKLAVLINSDYLDKQFPDRDWKVEYKDLFLEVKKAFDGALISDKIGISIKNIDQTLKTWN